MKELNGFPECDGHIERKMNLLIVSLNFLDPEEKREKMSIKSLRILEKQDIAILPLHILLGGEEYEDGRDITIEEIYGWSEAHKEMPKTSAPSIDRAIELFEPHIKQGNEIVCFSISGTMSASENIMRMTAEQLVAESSIYVIDSQDLSTGIGLLVVEAATMAKDGRMAEEIVEQVRQYLESLDIFSEIWETRAGGVVSSHCGPGTLGVLFIASDLS